MIDSAGNYFIVSSGFPNHQFNCGQWRIATSNFWGAVVTTIGENNERVLPPDSAIFAVPSPHHLAEALEDAVTNPPDRAKLIEKASQIRWEDETAKVEAIFKRLLQESA